MGSRARNGDDDGEWLRVAILGVKTKRHKIAASSLNDMHPEIERACPRFFESAGDLRKINLDVITRIAESLQRALRPSPSGCGAAATETTTIVTAAAQRVPRGI